MAKNYGLTADGEKADVQRGDLPRFFPSDLLPFKNNYRFGTNDTDPEVRAAREAEIEDMVIDLCEKGQLQPIIVHPVSGNRFQVHAGDTRHQAFLRIEQRGLPWKWGRKDDNGRPRIECIVQENGDPKRTFGTSVTENLSRNNLTVIDIANAVMIAIDEHKYTDAEVLRDFKQLKPDGSVKDPAWLPNMRRLARLPVEIKRQIHLKQMAPAVGYLLADIPEEAHAEVLAEAAGELPASSEPISVRDYVSMETPAPLIATGFYEAMVESNGGIDPRSTTPEEIDSFLDSHEPSELIEPTLDYSESQAPPRLSGQTSTGPKKVTARAVATAAKKRGLLKHKKVANTIAGIKEFWQPYADSDKDGSTLIGRLAHAELAFVADANADAFHKAVIGILRGVK